MGQQGRRGTHLVGLVVVLRVVLEDLGLLLVVECGHELVNTAAKLFSPVLEANEPSVVLAIHVCVNR